MYPQSFEPKVVYSMVFLKDRALQLSKERVLPDRVNPIEPQGSHWVLGRPLLPPFPKDTQQIIFGMGCFWGAERLFWTIPGIYVTAVGYAGGVTVNPSYEDVCSGRTGHAEVVLAVYDPQLAPLGTLLRHFWESHDPTQGMRQGYDVGSQYRSAIYCNQPAQLDLAEQSRALYQKSLAAKGLGAITTEIRVEHRFFYAEDYHQQYLAKHPEGYCGLAGTGAVCPPL